MWLRCFFVKNLQSERSVEDNPSTWIFLPHGVTIRRATASSSGFDELRDEEDLFTYG